MKKILFGTLVLSSILLFSCGKDETGPAVPAVSYLTVTPGQIRTFENKDSISGAVTVVTQTTSTTDTSVGGKSYRIFNNSNGTNEYFAVSGNDYYTLYNLPAGISTEPIELLYLKATGTVGSTWSQNYSFNVPGVPIAIPVKFTHTIKETGLTKTTGSLTHTDVIRVETKISSTLLSINSDIQTYCAPKYGVVYMTSYIAEATAGIEISSRRTLINANF